MASGGWPRWSRSCATSGPNVIVSTGDMTDASPERLAEDVRMLAEVRAPLGKFAIFGNHEFYNGIDNSTRFHEAAGFVLLRQQAVEPDSHLRIVGVDDPAGGSASRNDEDAVLPAQADGLFTLLLKHRPQAAQGSLGRYDLQLSGHTHGGQIFPFHVFSRLAFPLGPGLHQLTERSALYLSRGSGTWGPPMRVLAPPEVTIIRLEPL